MMIFMVLFPKDVEVGGGKDGKPYAKQEGCEHVPSEMAARFGFVVLSHFLTPFRLTSHSSMGTARYSFVLIAFAVFSLNVSKTA